MPLISRNLIKNLQRNRRKVIIISAIIIPSAVICGFLLLEILIYLCPFNPALVEGKLASNAQLYVDRNGRHIFASVSPDGFWRFPVALDQISPEYIQSVINTEDKRFYKHHGVDWIAGFRALTQYIRNGRVISGASTISMQLARLAHPESRSFPAKIRQVLRAIHIERIRSKDWILNAYLNLLPFGGNIEGVEAASRIYFVKPAQDLHIYESTLLAAIPQSPERLRPDKFPVEAGERQSRILADLSGDLTKLSEKTFDQYELPVYVKESYVKTSSLPYLRVPVDHMIPEAAHFTWANANVGQTIQNRNQWIKHTSLDAKIQKGVASLAASLSSLNHSNATFGQSVPDKAVVVIDNHSGDVRALLGSMDLQNGKPGRFVNAAISPRSPGSALKPWIYYLAMRQGKIVPETVLIDKWDPGRSSLPNGYRPQNFEPIENGYVSATDALAWSLNIPAVQLLAKVGVDEFAEVLASFGIAESRPDTSMHGLALALGSYSVTPLDLAKGYFRLFKTAEQSRASDERDASRLVFSMLSSRPFPDFHLCPVAWKTGTSNGHRDAWCVAVTADWTVCIWIGHKDGRNNKSLTGIDSAQPLCAAVLSFLHSEQPGLTNERSGQFLNLSSLPKQEICRQTGLAATAHCPHRLERKGIENVKLSWCARHLSLDNANLTTGIDTTTADLVIEEPSSKVYISSAQNGMAEIILRAKRNHNLQTGKLYWFLNGRFATQSSGVDHTSVNLPNGEYQLFCVTHEGLISSKVQFIVTR